MKTRNQEIRSVYRDYNSLQQQLLALDSTEGNEELTAAIAEKLSAVKVQRDMFAVGYLPLIECEGVFFSKQSRRFESRPEQSSDLSLEPVDVLGQLALAAA